MSPQVEGSGYVLVLIVNRCTEDLIFPATCLYVIYTQHYVNVNTCGDIVSRCFRNNVIHQ